MFYLVYTLGLYQYAASGGFRLYRLFDNKEQADAFAEELYAEQKRATGNDVFDICVTAIQCEPREGFTDERTTTD